MKQVNSGVRDHECLEGLMPAGAAARDPSTGVATSHPDLGLGAVRPQLGMMRDVGFLAQSRNSELPCLQKPRCRDFEAMFGYALRGFSPGAVPYRGFCGGLFMANGTTGPLIMAPCL